jgi:uncharacterized protein (DUF1015 family)
MYAFQGLHYDFQQPQDGHAAGDLAAPPYDQIDDALRDALHAMSPFHFSQLTRPVAADGLDPYRRADLLHGEWLASGTIRRDLRPGVYPYVIELADGSRRLGLCALIGLEAAGSRNIQPHEHTLDKPLADRLELLSTLRVDLEPAFFLAEDGGQLDRLLGEDVAAAEPLTTHIDPQGHRHHLYRVEDPDRLERYRAALAAGPGAIADGHHRYKVAQKFAHLHHPVAGTAAAAKLAVVTSIASPALSIDPIHRGLATAPDLDRLRPLATGVEPWEPPAAEPHRALAAAVAAAPQPALGVLLPSGGGEIWQLDPGRAPATLSPDARQLAVVLLHEALFAALGLTRANWTDGTVTYRADGAKLYREVTGGALAVGFFLPPMAPDEFAAAIAHGEMLPPKSTRFLPKVVSGLVWADHTSQLA